MTSKLAAVAFALALALPGRAFAESEAPAAEEAEALRTDSRGGFGATG